MFKNMMENLIQKKEVKFTKADICDDVVISLGTAIAVDCEDYKYQKDVNLHICANQKHKISFGGPVQYHLSAFIMFTKVKQEESKGLCIDAMGLNHRGVEDVIIPWDQVNAIAEHVETVVEYIKKSLD